MRLTQEQREEGRRRLKRLRTTHIEAYEHALADWHVWTRQYADALLADPEIDVEEIKREAVREFARKVASKFGANAQSWSVLANVDSLPAGRELARARSDLWLAAADEVMVAAARGVNLDEKP